MNDLFPYYTIGHFINQPGSDTEFEITRFEEMEEPEVDDIHRHTFYEILWVEEGKSRQTIDYVTYEIDEYSLFFISPGQLHEFEEWQPLKGGTIMFTSDFCLINQQNHDMLFEMSFLDNFYVNPSLRLSNENYTEIKGTIDLLVKEKQRADSNASILQSYLHVLLRQIQRSIDLQRQHNTPKRYNVLYKRFKNLIEQRLTENYSASDYADMLNITSHHLNHLTKTVTGKTATMIIRSRTMLEAKRLLTFTDLTVSEIATHLGFYDSSYFTRLFKKETHCAPLSFKRQISEKYRTR